MTSKISELEALALLKRGDQWREAQAAVADPVSPGGWQVAFFSGIAVAASAYVLLKEPISMELRLLLMNFLFGGIALAIEQWRMRRRFNAAIRLLMLHDEPRA